MADWVRILLAVGIVAVLVGLFVLSYVLNKRTPEPPGCIKPGEECETCDLLGCSRHPSATDEAASVSDVKKEEGK